MVIRRTSKIEIQVVDSPRKQLSDRDSAVVAAAMRILEERCVRNGLTMKMSSPKAVSDWLKLRMSDLEHEVFSVLFFDAQNGLLHSEDMFSGTLTQTSVYPREVVKRALAHNAASVILAHNHPSGVAEPSAADRLLTDALTQALALVDVKVLDHIIVGRGKTLSFAENGLL